MAKIPGGMGNMNNMMKQVQQMQKKMENMQKELEKNEVEASVGGGIVKAIINGKKELLRIKINPEVVDPDDVEMLEDLIVSAVREASIKADEMMEKEMAKITGGIKIPGLI